MPDKLSRATWLKVLGAHMIEAEPRSGDDLDPARGIMWGVIVGSAIWFLIAVVVVAYFWRGVGI